MPRPMIPGIIILIVTSLCFIGYFYDDVVNNVSLSVVKPERDATYTVEYEDQSLDDFDEVMLAFSVLVILVLVIFFYFLIKKRKSKTIALQPSISYSQAQYPPGQIPLTSYSPQPQQSPLTGKPLQQYISPPEQRIQQQSPVIPPQAPLQQSQSSKPHHQDSPSSIACIFSILIIILGFAFILLSVGSDIQVLLEDEIEEVSFGMSQKDLAYVAISLSGFTIFTSILSGRRVSYMFHDRKVLERHELLNPDTPLGTAAKIAIGTPLFIVFLIIILNTILKIVIGSASQVTKTIGAESGGEVFSAIGGILLILGSYMLFQKLAEKKHYSVVLTMWGKGIKSGMDLTHRGVKRVEKETQAAKEKIDTHVQATSEAYQSFGSAMSSIKPMSDNIPSSTSMINDVRKEINSLGELVQMQDQIFDTPSQEHHPISQDTIEINQWSCGKCGLMNDGGVKIQFCEYCGSPREYSMKNEVRTVEIDELIPID
jgi:hypothetical protein